MTGDFISLLIDKYCTDKNNISKEVLFNLLHCKSSGSLSRKELNITISKEFYIKNKLLLNDLGNVVLCQLKKINHYDDISDNKTDNKTLHDGALSTAVHATKDYYFFRSVVPSDFLNDEELLDENWKVAIDFDSAKALFDIGELKADDILGTDI